MTLEQFLPTADVPEFRRDLKRPENVLWLVRNLPIRNASLPGFKEAFDELKQIVRSM